VIAIRSTAVSSAHQPSGGTPDWSAAVWRGVPRVHPRPGRQGCEEPRPSGCSAGRLDQLDAERGRLQALGATIAWEEEFPPEDAAVYRNVVLRNIEGNEFCLGAGNMARTHRPDEISVRAAAAADRRVVL
jgi:hypothetical protein